MCIFTILVRVHISIDLYRIFLFFIRIHLRVCKPRIAPLQDLFKCVWMCVSWCCCVLVLFLFFGSHPQTIDMLENWNGLLLVAFSIELDDVPTLFSLYFAYSRTFRSMLFRFFFSARFRKIKSLMRSCFSHALFCCLLSHILPFTYIIHTLFLVLRLLLSSCWPFSFKCTHIFKKNHYISIKMVQKMKKKRKNLNQTKPHHTIPQQTKTKPFRLFSRFYKSSISNIEDFSVHLQPMRHSIHFGLFVVHKRSSNNNNEKKNGGRKN